MSHKQPNGTPPPPYSYSYVYESSSHLPNRGSVSSYACVPTPVVMPIPMPVYPTHSQLPQQPAPVQPSQPTYVTNYVYQTPAAQPAPIRAEEDVVWESATSATAKALAHRAFIAGNEGDNPLWVIRAHHRGDLVPGKFSVKNCKAYIPYGKKEVPVQDFEVLLAQPHRLHWLPSNHGQVPLGAFPGGYTYEGEPLYIARVFHKGILRGQARPQIPGKVHPSYGCCFISSNGLEIPFKHYEVLCKVPS